MLKYPLATQLVGGTRIAPDQIREVLGKQMKSPKGQYSRDALWMLRAYLELFPDTKWISEAEREWIDNAEKMT